MGITSLVATTKVFSKQTMPTPISSARSWVAKVVVPITKGKLDLGPWEHVFCGEFDGRRKKRALVKIMGD